MRYKISDYAETDGKGNYYYKKKPSLLNLTEDERYELMRQTALEMNYLKPTARDKRML